MLKEKVWMGDEKELLKVETTIYEMKNTPDASSNRLDIAEGKILNL